MNSLDTTNVSSRFARLLWLTATLAVGIAVAGCSASSTTDSTRAAPSPGAVATSIGNNSVSTTSADAPDKGCSAFAGPNPTMTVFVQAMTERFRREQRAAAAFQAPWPILDTTGTGLQLVLQNYDVSMQAVFDNAPSGGFAAAAQLICNPGDLPGVTEQLRSAAAAAPIPPRQDNEFDADGYAAAAATVKAELPLTKLADTLATCRLLSIQPPSAAADVESGVTQMYGGSAGSYALRLMKQICPQAMS